jgi:hypothetical protein
MIVDWLVRANMWAERHRTLVAAVAVAAFALSCAHYARFIRLPEIVALPAVATGILTGLRYALWDGWLKRRVEARRALGGPPAVDRPVRRPARAEARRRSRGAGAPGEGGSAENSEAT